jgi:hypothetical protein
MDMNGTRTHACQVTPLVEVTSDWINSVKFWRATKVIIVALLLPATHGAPGGTLKLNAAGLIGKVDNPVGDYVVLSEVVKAPDLQHHLRPPVDSVHLEIVVEAVRPYEETIFVSVSGVCLDRMIVLQRLPTILSVMQVRFHEETVRIRRKVCSTHDLTDEKNLGSIITLSFELLNL